MTKEEAINSMTATPTTILNEKKIKQLYYGWCGTHRRANLPRKPGGVLLKTLPPSLRDRKRYLAIEIIAEYDVSREELLREIFAAIGSLLGDIGSSECGLRLLDYDKQKGILRCSHMMSEKSRAALATITSIGGQRAIVHVLGIFRNS
jgi:ribonuclease P/MRP protein subunit POP5